MLSINSITFESLGFKINKFKYSLCASQKWDNLMVSYRYRAFNLYALFKRSFKNHKINSLIHKDFNSYTFSIPEYTKKKMFRTYMTVSQSYSLFLGITQYVLYPL